MPDLNEITLKQTEEENLDYDLTKRPICPLCGEKKDSLVNCGAHDNKFSEPSKLISAPRKLCDIIGKASETAYNSEERDCFVCPQCRSIYLQMPSFCPLYVLYQGIYAFLDEQATIFGRDEEESIKAFWNYQSKGDVNPNAVIHRYKIAGAIDDTNVLSEIY